MPELRNTLLEALSEDDRQALGLQPVALALGEVLHNPREPVETVTWVGSGLLSIVAYTRSGKSVETSMVGREGAGGLVEACGSRLSYLTVLVQIAGSGWRAPANRCRDLFDRSPRFRDLVLRYAEVLFAEARQSAVCQAAHSAESRCARWLLESGERSGAGDQVPLTQEYLAAMLGVQRTTVTSVAGALERRGLLRQRRASFEILDHAGLEAGACECRHDLQAHRRALGLASHG